MPVPLCGAVSGPELAGPELVGPGEPLLPQPGAELANLGEPPLLQPGPGLGRPKVPPLLSAGPKPGAIQLFHREEREDLSAAAVAPAKKYQLRAKEGAKQAVYAAALLPPHQDRECLLPHPPASQGHLQRAFEGALQQTLQETLEGVARNQAGAARQGEAAAEKGPPGAEAVLAIERIPLLIPVKRALPCLHHGKNCGCWKKNPC